MDDSLVSFALLSAVSSVTSLAKKRVAPDLVSSSAAAKSAILLLLLVSCCRRASEEEEVADGDRQEVLCVGSVNPLEELMSSAEAEKSSAAEAAVGLDEAVMAAMC